MLEKNDKALVEFITKLLTLPKAPDDTTVEELISDDPDLQKLYSHILALRELSTTLGKGNLECNVLERGFILSNMKALQANLRHLTWQARRISVGDYSQKVDFLGDFSDAFNYMTSTLQSATHQLMDIARLDSLTNIPNRLSLNEFIDQAFKTAAEEQKSLFVFMFDIDNFKNVNDKYGHSAGDKVLVNFTGIMNKQFRSSDIFARYGGEEFVAVLPDVNLENALQIGERSLHSIADADFVIDDDLTLKITVSIGISNIRADDTSFEDILKRSDDALYDAKNCGRNCFRVIM